MMYKTLLILNVLHAENSKIQMLKKWKIIIKKFNFIFRLSTTLKYRPQRAEVNKKKKKQTLICNIRLYDLHVIRYLTTSTRKIIMT